MFIAAKNIGLSPLPVLFLLLVFGLAATAQDKAPLEEAQQKNKP